MKEKKIEKIGKLNKNDEKTVEKKTTKNSR